MREKWIMVSLRISTEEAARLDELARATDRDRSKVLRRLLRLAIALPDGGLMLMQSCDDRVAVKGDV